MRPTLGEAVAAAAVDLASCGIADPRREARLLVALAAGLETAAVLTYPERALELPAEARLQDMVRRRRKREPVSRLIGQREFWSLEFEVGPATLDPRPDSETLVEAALGRIGDRGARLKILDLGTGTGCLLLALLSELPNAFGLGFDLAPEAVAVARRNAAANALESRAFFAVGDWGAAARGGFDVVLANPPYVPSAEIARLAPEVALWEPRLALDGGADGSTRPPRFSRWGSRDSRRSSSRSACSTPRRRTSSRPARHWFRNTGARCRARARRSSSCRASGARPRTS